MYGYSGSNDSDCVTLVAAHDRIVALLPAEVPGEPEGVRNARATAYQGVTQFLAGATSWTDSCRQKLAAGETTNVISRSVFREVMSKLESADAPWNQAVQMLEP
jgi:hypothetical protein